MIYVIKGRSVRTNKLAESLSKVTVNPKTPTMFKMLTNYKPTAKVIAKKK